MGRGTLIDIVRMCGSQKSMTRDRDIVKRLRRRMESSIPIKRIARSNRVADLRIVQIALDRRIARINKSNFSLPPKLIVENTNHCNAACIMCPYPLMKRKKGVMTLDLYRKIVDEYSRNDATRRVQMNNIGEPLLDPQIITKIEYAKKKGIDDVFLFTNGSLLTKSTSEAMVNSQLDHLIVSLDGVSAGTYGKIRAKLKFEQVMENLREFVATKKVLCSKKPILELHMTLVDDNNQEEKRFVKQMKALADYVTVARAHDWAGQKANCGTVETQKRPTLKSTPCSNLWSELTILWDGRVAMCCLDYEGIIILGDLKTESLFNIWNGSRLKTLREMHLKMEFDSMELCRECSQHNWTNWFQDYWK